MKAIIVMYDGKSVNPVSVETIQNAVLACQTEPIEVNILLLNDKEVSEALLRKASGPATHQQAKNVPLRSAEDEAVIYLGTKYKENIGIHMAPFCISLTNDYVKAKNSKFFTKDSQALINAVEVLGRKKNVVISNDLLNKYNFNAEVLSFIDYLYHNVN